MSGICCRFFFVVSSKMVLECVFVPRRLYDFALYLFLTLVYLLIRLIYLVFSISFLNFFGRSLGVRLPVVLRGFLNFFFFFYRLANDTAILAQDNTAESSIQKLLSPKASLRLYAIGYGKSCTTTPKTNQFINFYTWNPHIWLEPGATLRAPERITDVCDIGCQKTDYPVANIQLQLNRREDSV